MDDHLVDVVLMDVLQHRVLHLEVLDRHGHPLLPQSDHVFCLGVHASEFCQLSLDKRVGVVVQEVQLHLLLEGPNETILYQSSGLSQHPVFVE